MSVNVTYSGKHLDSLFNQSAMNKAEYVVANQAMADMDQFVPYKQGHLAGSAHIDNNKHTIVYDGPYARAQFYGMIHGYPVKNYTQTPGRYPTKRWDLQAKSLCMDKWLHKVSESLLGGR